MSNVHTAAIARVQKVNTSTIDVKPVVNRVINGESIELPVFPEVLPLFLGGGSSYTSYPIAVGDYCLLIFSERCFDNWYAGNDFEPPLDKRMHDYSDAIALCGLKVASELTEIPSSTVINGAMKLGSPTASDFVALASKVDTELTKIQTTLSTGSNAGGPVVFATPYTPAATGSSKVGAE
jgi:hypothetical protein